MESERASGVGCWERSAIKKERRRSDRRAVKDETTNGWAQTSSGMGMDLGVVVTSGIGGLARLPGGCRPPSLGNSQLGAEWRALDWNSRGSQPKTRSSRPGKVDSGGIRRRQAFRLAVRGERTGPRGQALCKKKTASKFKSH